jgi:hypothetical protein
LTRDVQHRGVLPNETIRDIQLVLTDDLLETDDLLSMEDMFNPDAEPSRTQIYRNLENLSKITLKTAEITFGIS